MKSSRAFTLVEVLVSIIIIAIIAIAGFEFLVFCQRFIAGAKKSSEAVNDARGLMEEVYWQSAPSSDPPTTTVVLSASGEYNIITVIVDTDDY